MSRPYRTASCRRPARCRPAPARSHVAGRSEYRIASLVSSATGLAFAVDVVEQDVVAEAVRAGKKGATAVHPGHLLDERDQVIVVVEHEGVDHDLLTRT